MAYNTIAHNELANLSGQLGLLKPHPTRNFAAMPATVESLFKGAWQKGALPADCIGNKLSQYDKVVVLFIDAMGETFLKERLNTNPLLQRFVAAGTLSPITSQFPSTTSAHVPTIMTGEPVSVHGTIEYRYRDANLKSVFNALKCRLKSYRGDEPLNEGKLREVFSTTSFPAKLKAEGIETYSIIPEEHTETIFNKHFNGNAQLRPYVYYNLVEGLTILKQAILDEPNRAYYYFYYPALDGVSHEHGPKAQATQNVCNSILEGIERYLVEPLSKRSPSTAFLMIADHGQVAFDETGVIALEDHLPNLDKLMEEDVHGYPIKLTGSPRDVMLYTKPEALDEVVGRLNSTLSDRVLIKRTSEMIGEGYWGDPKLFSPRFVANLPTAWVLGTQTDNVFWRGRPGEKRGHHGGLTRKEMVTYVGFLGNA